MRLLKGEGDSVEPNKLGHAIRLKQHDIKQDNVLMECSVTAVPCGADIVFEAEMEVPMFGKQKVQMASMHVHPRWWWKYVGKTLDKEVLKRIKALKKTVADSNRNNELLQRLQ